MEKKVYFIDASGFTSRNEAHAIMKKVFSDCEYYGSNLDALHDVLTTIGTDTEIRIDGLEVARVYMDGYIERIKRVFLDSAEENPHITVVFEEAEKE